MSSSLSHQYVLSVSDQRLIGGSTRCCGCGSGHSDIASRVTRESSPRSGRRSARTDTSSPVLFRTACRTSVREHWSSIRACPTSERLSRWLVHRRPCRCHASSAPNLDTFVPFRRPPCPHAADRGLVLAQ